MRMFHVVFLGVSLMIQFLVFMDMYASVTSQVKTGLGDGGYGRTVTTLACPCPSSDKYFGGKGSTGSPLGSGEEALQMTPQTFQVGDVVERCTTMGVVESANYESGFPIGVNFGDGIFESFTIDGRLLDWHTEPSLKLISRPKQKVKKTREVWVNVYPLSEYSYKSKEIADRCSEKDRLACVPVVLEWEEEL